MSIVISKDRVKKIFVLEDDENRQQWFKKTFSEVEEFHMVADAETAKKLLVKFKYDIIFLDHDLGERVYVDSSDPETGYQVMLIIPGSINEDTYIIVHSLNTVGAKNMVNVRPKNTSYVPYLSLIQENGILLI